MSHYPQRSQDIAETSGADLDCAFEKHFFHNPMEKDYFFRGYQSNIRYGVCPGSLEGSEKHIRKIFYPGDLMIGTPSYFLPGVHISGSR